MKLPLNINSLDDYRRFLRIRQLPIYSFRGESAEIPDEYASQLGVTHRPRLSPHMPYTPSGFLFDYQRDISTLAIAKQKFAVFADCGLGKTLILLEFAKYVCRRAIRHPHTYARTKGRVLIVSPLMVIDQTLSEAKKFYGGSLPIQRLPAADLQRWLQSGSGVAITNYEALNNLSNSSITATSSASLQGRYELAGLIVDESSMLKSAYGKWGQAIICLGRGVEHKLALTGTPAPNDRIEYANHAVFLDAARTVNEFLGSYFVNRGQTDNRWELKPHALGPFYRDLSHWCIFLTNPATYGWKDNSETIPPIHTHIHQVGLTAEQRSAVQDETGGLFVSQLGGIGQRSKLGQIAKGNHGGVAVETLKPQFIRDLVDSWPGESTLIWCLYNDEQNKLAKLFPEAASIDGDTPHAKRMEDVARFKSGECPVLISKGKVLGFGLNLQVATRQIFSGLNDSFETFYQCVKRSNRYGSTRPLNVHIPVTEIEEPMVANVLRKADRVQQDTEQQEAIFLQERNRLWNR